MSRKPSINEGQFPLFKVPDDELSRDDAIRTWQELEQDATQSLEDSSADIVGPHVIITERAERLIMALNALAHRNMLQGFDVGVHDERYREPIWERYSDGTPKVIDNSRSKVERLEDEAFTHFDQAMGFEALRGTGVITVGEYKSRSDKMRRDFHAELGTPQVHGELVKFRRTQMKHLPKDHPLRAKKQRKAQSAEERAA